MKKVLAALAASGVLVAGGFATAAISTPSTAVAQEQTDEAPLDSTSEENVRPERGAILEEVLGELVVDGVITSDQADQIAAALEAKHDELRAEFGDRRSPRGFRGDGGLRALLEDGVIDADELAELPEDHPVFDPEGPFADYLDDDQLTIEELEEIRGEMAPHDGFRGRGFGRPGGQAPAEDAASV